MFPFRRRARLFLICWRLRNGIGQLSCSFELDGFGAGPSTSYRDGSFRARQIRPVVAKDFGLGIEGYFPEYYVGGFEYML